MQSDKSTFSDQRLWAYLDGEASADEGAAIETAAAENAALAAQLAEMRILKDEVLVGAPMPPADFADRVVAVAKKYAAPILDLREAHRMLRRALVAAAILAAVGMGLLAARIVPELLEPAPIQASPPDPWSIGR